jgi:hypothetical protein
MHTATASGNLQQQQLSSIEHQTASNSNTAAAAISSRI